MSGHILFANCSLVLSGTISHWNRNSRGHNKVYGEGIIFHTISSASAGICHTICQPIRKLEETSVSLMGYCSWWLLRDDPSLGNQVQSET